MKMVHLDSSESVAITYYTSDRTVLIFYKGQFMVGIDK